MTRSYDISDLRDSVAWEYFFHAWGLSGAGEKEKNALRADGERMLDAWEGRHFTRMTLERRAAFSEGDDIIIGETVFPMLRRQRPPYLCLADFVRPRGKGPDEIGLFATSADAGIGELSSEDPYERMLAQTLADRLAEAAAEKVGLYMPGIRPAPGYPSMPDTGINFLIDRVIDMGRIGISLTPSGMMRPHASVSGLVFPHPGARYFDTGPVGEDQLADYARRRGLTPGQARRFVRM